MVKVQLPEGKKLSDYELNKIHLKNLNPSDFFVINSHLYMVVGRGENYVEAWMDVMKIASAQKLKLNLDTIVEVPRKIELIIERI